MKVDGDAEAAEVVSAEAGGEVGLRRCWGGGGWLIDGGVGSEVGGSVERGGQPSCYDLVDGCCSVDSRAHSGGDLRQATTGRCVVTTGLVHVKRSCSGLYRMCN
jgi:hypothetical protein